MGLIHFINIKAMLARHLFTILCILIYNVGPEFTSYFFFVGCMGPGQHHWGRPRLEGLCDLAGRGAASPHVHKPGHTHLLPQAITS